MAAPPPPPPSLAHLKRLTSREEIAGRPHQSSAPPQLPNGTSRPPLQRQTKPKSMDSPPQHGQTAPPLPPGKPKSMDSPPQHGQTAPPLPPGKPRAQSVQSTTAPPPPPQRTKPVIQRQEARRDSRDNCPPPLPPARTNEALHCQGRPASVDQGQGHRAPPPLPPRDRAVSLDEQSLKPSTMTKARKTSEPSRPEPHAAPPPLPNRRLPPIPANPSPLPVTTGSSDTCAADRLTEQELLKSQESFEEQFIFPPVTKLPAPELFIENITRIYPSKMAKEGRINPP